MYLHLGQSVVIPFREVIGIFDMDNSTSSHLTRTFLRRAEQAGRVVTINEELPKSFTLCENSRGEMTVYISQLSAATLLKRTEAGILE